MNLNEIPAWSDIESQPWFAELTPEEKQQSLTKWQGDMMSFAKDPKEKFAVAATSKAKARSFFGEEMPDDPIADALQRRQKDLEDIGSRYDAFSKGELEEDDEEVLTLNDTLKGNTPYSVIKGRLFVSPQLVWDKAAYEKVVNEAPVDEDERVLAMSAYDGSKERAAEGVVNSLGYTDEAFRDFAAKGFKEGKSNAAILDEWKANNKLPDGILGSLRGVGRQAYFGLRSGLSGLERAMGGLGGFFGSESAQKYAEESGKEAQSYMQRTLGEGPEFIGELTSGAVSIIPTMAAGAAASLFTEGAALPAAASVTAGAIQSAGATQAETYEFYRNQGLDHANALAESRVDGLVSGLITGAITHYAGKLGDKIGLGKGIEGLFSGPASKIASKLTQREISESLKAGAKAVGGSFLQEGSEELLDQAAQDAYSMIKRDPTLTLAEAINNALQAGKVGAVLGGAAEAGKIGLKSLLNSAKFSVPTTEEEEALRAKFEVPAAVEEEVIASPEVQQEEQNIKTAADVVKEAAPVAPQTAAVLAGITEEKAGELAADVVGATEEVLADIEAEAPLVSPEATISPKPPVSPASETAPISGTQAPAAASMPMMVTREMNQQLADLGYSRKERNALRPEQAAAIIAAGVRKEKPVSSQPPQGKPVETPTNALPISPATPSLPREERPEMGLQQVGEGNAQPEKVAETRSEEVKRKLRQPYASIAVPDLEKVSTQDWMGRRDYLEGKLRNNQQERTELLKTPKQNWESREYNESAKINEVAASLRAAIQDMQLARPDLERVFAERKGRQDEESIPTGYVGGAGTELQQQLETLPSISGQPKITEIAGRSRGDDLLARDTSSNVVETNVQKFAANIRAQFKADELVEKAEKLKEKYYSINASAGKKESEAKDKAFQQWRKTEARAKQASADAFAELRKQNKGFTIAQLEDREPFMVAKTLDQHGLTRLATDLGYVKQGDLYVFQTPSPPTTGAVPTETLPAGQKVTPGGVASPAVEAAPAPAPEAQPEQPDAKEKAPTEPSESTLSIAKRFGGRIAWSQGDLAIIEGFQLFGSKSLYVAVVGDRYSLTDFTLMKPEQRKALLGDNEELFLRKREEIVEANNRMLAQNPDGPFTNGQTVVVSKNVPQNVASVFREWVRLLGLSAPTRIVLTTPRDGIDMAAEYGGKFRRIGVTSLMSDNERGQMTPLGEDDFHIFYKEDTSYARTLEVLAHELGHILERQSFKNLPDDQRKAIIAEHEKWLKRVGSQKALDGIRELRSMRVGRIHPNFGRADDRFDSLNAYWKSFSEWFADQVARWATTTDKPLTVIEKFFARLGKKLREFFNLKGSQFAPNQRIADWLNSLSPDLNAVVEETLAPAEPATKDSLPVVRDTSKPEQMTPLEYMRKAVGAKFVESVAPGKEEAWWSAKEKQEAPRRYAAGTKMVLEENGRFFVLDLNTNKYKGFGSKREAFLFFKAKDGRSERRYIEALSGKKLDPLSRIDHKIAVDNAVKNNAPVSAETVDAYGIKLPEGYVKQGELYVYEKTQPLPKDDTAGERGAVAPAPTVEPAPEAQPPVTKARKDAKTKKEAPKTLAEAEAKIAEQSAAADFLAGAKEEVAQEALRNKKGAFIRENATDAAEANFLRDLLSGGWDKSLDDISSGRVSVARADTLAKAAESANLIDAFTASRFSQTAGKQPVSQPVQAFRDAVSQMTPTAQAKWTPELRATAEAYLDSGGTTGLQGLSDVQQKVVGRFLPEEVKAAFDAEDARKRAQRNKLPDHRESSLPPTPGKQIRKIGKGAMESVPVVLDEIAKVIPNIRDLVEVRESVEGEPDAEGFYDPQADKAVVLVDNVYLKPQHGGSQEAALRETIIHELLHRGFAKLRQTNPQLFEQFEAFSLADTNDAQFDALVRRGYSMYSNWKDDPAQNQKAREEIFIRKAVVDLNFKGIEAIKSPSSLASQFFSWLRGLLNKLLGRKVDDETLLHWSRVFLNAAQADFIEKTPGERMHAFAGEKAIENLPEERRQFMRDSLETAKAMAAAGKDSEEIRAVTGWFPGKYDNKMRWEVPDGGATWMEAARGMMEGIGEKQFRLGDILKHDALFEAYPDLKGITVSVQDSSFDGEWIKEANTVLLRRGLGGEKALSTLIHEIQHAIQDKEGFARGTNPPYEQMQHDVARASSLERSKAAREAWWILRESLEKGASLDEAKASVEKMSDTPLETGWLSRIRRSGDNLEELERRMNQASEAIPNPQDVSQDRYRRSAGEIEARDVQARQNFTPEQRKATAPYSSENIAKEDAIVMFGGGAQMSLAPTEKYARHAELEAKHNAGTITPEETAEAQALVHEAAKGAGFNVGPVYHHGGFDIRENAVPDTARGFHMGTRQAAEERAFGKPVDDFIAEAEITYDEDLGAWFWSSQGTDSYDVVGEDGFSSEASARRSLEEFASQEDFSGSEIEDLGNLTAAYMRVSNPLITTDQKADWEATIKLALVRGNDSVQYRNEFEDKGSTSYIALQEGQIKSADPFTGVPLEQRFQPTSPDIRYSLGEPPDMQAEADALREVTPNSQALDKFRETFGTPRQDVGQVLGKKEGSVYTQAQVAPLIEYARSMIGFENDANGDPIISPEATQKALNMVAKINGTPGFASQFNVRAAEVFKGKPVDPEIATAVLTQELQVYANRLSASSPKAEDQILKAALTPFYNTQILGSYLSRRIAGRTLQAASMASGETGDARKSREEAEKAVSKEVTKQLGDEALPAAEGMDKAGVEGGVDAIKDDIPAPADPTLRLLDLAVESLDEVAKADANAVFDVLLRLGEAEEALERAEKVGNKAMSILTERRTAQELPSTVAELKVLVGKLRVEAAEKLAKLRSSLEGAKPETKKKVKAKAAKTKSKTDSIQKLIDKLSKMPDDSKEAKPKAETLRAAIADAIKEKKFDEQKVRDAATKFGATPEQTERLVEEAERIHEIRQSPKLSKAKLRQFLLSFPKNVLANPEQREALLRSFLKGQNYSEAEINRIVPQVLRDFDTGYQKARKAYLDELEKKLKPKQGQKESKQDQQNRKMLNALRSGLADTTSETSVALAKSLGFEAFRPQDDHILSKLDEEMRKLREQDRISDANAKFVQIRDLLNRRRPPRDFMQVAAQGWITSALSSLSNFAVNVWAPLGEAGVRFTSDILRASATGKIDEIPLYLEAAIQALKSMPPRAKFAFKTDTFTNSVNTLIADMASMKDELQRALNTYRSKDSSKLAKAAAAGRILFTIGDLSRRVLSTVDDTWYTALSSYIGSSNLIKDLRDAKLPKAAVQAIAFHANNDAIHQAQAEHATLDAVSQFVESLRGKTEEEIDAGLEYLGLNDASVTQAQADYIQEIVSALQSLRIRSGATGDDLVKRALKEISNFKAAVNVRAVELGQARTKELLATALTEVGQTPQQIEEAQRNYDENAKKAASFGMGLHRVEGVPSYDIMGKAVQIVDAMGRGAVTTSPLLGRMMVGFFGIPLNLLNKSLWFTPYGLGRYFLAKWQMAKNPEEKFYEYSMSSQREMSQRVNEIIIGHTIMAAAFALGAIRDQEDEEGEGLYITLGGPSNKTEYDAWYARGFRKFSFCYKTKDGSVAAVPYGRGMGEVLKMPLMLLGAFDDMRLNKKLGDREDMSSIIEYLNSAAAGIGNQATFLGAKNTVGAFAPDKIGANTASSIAYAVSNLVPFNGLDRSIAALAVGPPDRSRTGAILANIPIARWLATDPAINVFGDKWGNKSDANFAVLWDRQWNQGLIPLNISAPLTGQDKRLYGFIGERLIGPSPALRGALELRNGYVTDKQWYDYSIYRGQALKREMVTQLDRLRRMDDDSLSKAIAELSTKATKKAKDRFNYK